MPEIFLQFPIRIPLQNPNRNTLIFVGSSSFSPEPKRSEFLSLWNEYNNCSTPEAHLVKALDKAETILQHNQGKNPPDFDYAFNLTYGASYFKGDPRLEELRSILDAETNVVIEHTQEKENHHL